MHTNVLLDYDISNKITRIVPKKEKKIGEKDEKKVKTTLQIYLLMRTLQDRKGLESDTIQGTPYDGISSLISQRSDLIMKFKFKLCKLIA